MFSTLQNAYETIREPGTSTLNSYDVYFEPHLFSNFDLCVGKIDPKLNIFLRLDKAEQKKCCENVSELIGLNPKNCNTESDLIEKFTGNLSSCEKRRLRGPKTGKFIECPGEGQEIEPFTLYTDMDSYCNPYNPLNNTVVSNEWKYSRKK